MTKEEKRIFWKEKVSPNIKKNVNMGFGAACFSAAATALIALLVNPWLFADVVLMVGLGLGIGLARSRVCAVIMCVYFIYSKIMMLGNMDASSIVMAICFIALYVFGAIGTFQYHKFLADYEAERNLLQTNSANM